MDTIIELGKVTEETKGDGGEFYEDSIDDCEFPSLLNEVGGTCS